MTRETPPHPWAETPALDEVGVHVGPDRDAIGLFDAPTTGTASGEHTAGPASGPDRVDGPRRTAILAWIAAQPPPTEPATDGAPCEPLKRLVADEPLDPLPALDGVPPRPKEPRRPADREHVRLAPEAEDTATQIEGIEIREAAHDRTAETPREPTGSSTPGGPAPGGAPAATTRAGTFGVPARVIAVVAVLAAAWLLWRAA